MHNHHITPTYRDPNSTLTVEVSVTAHAMFHYCNWRLWGDKRDWLAWKGLCGEIPKEELVRELRRLGGQRAMEKVQANRTEAMRLQSLAQIPKMIEATNTPEALAKRRQTFQEIEHQQGERNSQYGKPKTKESNRQRSLKLQKFSQVVVKTPEGIKILTGSYQEMADSLGISKNSFQTLLRKGRLVKRGLKLESTGWRVRV